MSSENNEPQNQASNESSAGEKPRDADFSAFEDPQDSTQATANIVDLDSTKLQAEIVRLQAEVAENKDKHLRALAEFENFKRRSQKERSEIIKYQGERIIADLLDVLDNLEWALSHSSAEPDKLKAGIELIHKMFVDVLGRWEIRGESAVGKDFDPTNHQALSKVYVEGTSPGKIVSEFKKAYFYKDKLLRPGNVVVAAEPEASKIVNDGVESETSN